MKQAGLFFLLIQAVILAGHILEANDVRSTQNFADGASEHKEDFPLDTSSRADSDSSFGNSQRRLRGASSPTISSHFSRNAKRRRDGAEIPDSLEQPVHKRHSFISRRVVREEDQRANKDRANRGNLSRRRDTFRRGIYDANVVENTNNERARTGHLIEQRRYPRMTSKFTGLVVGASKDNKLKESVKNSLNQIEDSIWKLQSQITKPFDVTSQHYSTILGTFISSLETNFHGPNDLIQLRRSPSYSIPDVNSYTTLLILQCLAEASVYGGAPNPSVSNMSIAVAGLEEFHTHVYEGGSSVITMWPEKVSGDGKGWVNLPENIILAKVKGGTTFDLLQAVAKSCNCEPAKTGVAEISKEKLCKDYFATPIATLNNDVATPPDFVTSFANLALGSLFLARHHEDKNGGTKVFSAESELWLAANENMGKLIEKLKDMVIIFPASSRAASDDGNEPGPSKGANSTDKGGNSKGKDNISSEKRIDSDDDSVAGNNTSSGVSGGDRTNDQADSEKGIGDTGPVSGNVSGIVADSNGTNGSQSDSVSGSGTNSSVNVNPNVQVDGGGNDSVAYGMDNRGYANRILKNTVENETLDANINSSSIDDGENDNKVTSNPSLEVPPPTISTEGVTETSPANTTTTTTSTTTKTTSATTTTKSPTTTTAAAPITTTTATTTTTTTTKSLKKPHVNQIIDSASYYGLRPYLDEVVPAGKEDVILIPSLISDDPDPKSNTDQNDGNIWHNGKVFHTYNYVDLMTTATTLHALVVSSMTGLIDIQSDEMLQKIMTSSLRLLTWYVTHPKELVTMVTLSHFPSRYQLYWEASRIAFQLNSKQAQQSGEFKFADDAIKAFVTSLRVKMTYSILQSITDAGLGQDGKTRVYIDDFIGDADLDDKGKKKQSGDDRLFTSAMANSALIATWTTQQDDGSLKFVTGVSDPVRIAVNSLANYISGAVTDTTSPQDNAFMSEHVKNCETLPAWYPSNVITSFDGKEVDAKAPSLNLRFGVKGYIPKEEYQKQLETPPFGHKTRGGELQDLNSATSIFRFWSAEAYTKAASLLATAQAANLQVDGNS